MSADRSSVEAVVHGYFDALHEGDADKLGAIRARTIVVATDDRAREQDEAQRRHRPAEAKHEHRRDEPCEVTRAEQLEVRAEDDARLARSQRSPRRGRLHRAARQTP